MNSKINTKTGLLIFMLLYTIISNAQDLTGKKLFSQLRFKSNLLYDATASINAGAEMRLNERLSFDFPLSWNPFSFSDNRKWKHILLQPELRFWSLRSDKGSFFGIHTHFAFYNISNLPNPPFSQNMKQFRYQGWLIGMGAGYGYRWNLSQRWGLETEIALGYAYLNYEKYRCGACVDKLANGTKHYFGPTKAAFSLVYTIGKRNQPMHPLPQVNNQPVNVPQTREVMPDTPVSHAPFPKRTQSLKMSEVQQYTTVASGKGNISQPLFPIK